MLRRFIKQTKVNFADRSPSKCNVVKYLKLEQNATKFPSTIFNFRYLKTFLRISSVYQKETKRRNS